MKPARCLPLFFLAVVSFAHAQSPDAAHEFFESKIRPLLAKHCYACHSGNAKKLQANLHLDSKKGLLAGGDSGPAVVAGKPDESLLIQSVRFESYEMPPKGKLNERDIDLLEKWVKLGVPWPDENSPKPSRDDDKTDYDWQKLQQDHWSFRPITQYRLPTVNHRAWPQTGIDFFVLRRLEQQQLEPANKADRRTLVRRAFYDLLGFPPAADQVDAFVQDQNPDAFQRLIDTLLASPAYGERWGRHWLDVARYSDGFGNFNDSAALPFAFQYRDWVVRAFNRDLRYDDFVRHQIVGDLIAEGDSFLGTGFFAIGPTYRSDGGDPESVAQAKSETLDDRVDTMSRAFLALTVACARCHDHKFDPIPTLDYYSVAGIFQNTTIQNRPIASSEVVKAFQDSQKAIKDLQNQINQLRQKAKKEKRELSGEESKQLKQREENLSGLKKNAPPKYDECHALAEAGSKDMNVALRGDLRKPGPVAPRRFLQIVAGAEAEPFTNGSGRLELAEAIVSSDNSLTPRVFVNRLWQNHFGHGLVRTTSNFGQLGQTPSHPQLLDWLAAEFMNHDWSVKWLHRTIMLSATYQMDSRFRQTAFDMDGDNVWLWRMNKRRLDVESWRDSLLYVSGELNTQIGGLPVDNIFASRRRTLYAKISRSGDRFESDSLLRMFDFPTPRGSSAKREPSIVPQQFLFMMNNPFMIERAKSFARRLKSESGTEASIERAYRVLFGRTPSERERAFGSAFLEQEAANTDEKLTLLEQYAQILLSSNEFIQID